MKKLDLELVRLVVRYCDFERLLAEHPDLDRERLGGFRKQVEATKGPRKARVPRTTPAADRAILWTDGASLGNPGPAGVGARIVAQDGTVLAEVAEAIGRATNNVAEYRALLRGLLEAAKLGLSSLEIRSDSELLVRQIQGIYRVRDPNLARLHREATHVLAGFGSWRIQSIPREQNREADALSRRALG
ncbi:MAG: ribonuclease HI family protein [Planctomycetes bacterium]|nr:ribonuclease HI family protein [Planctomycetota bacterium]